MDFKTVRVFYTYPSDPAPRHYAKEYTVPDNEPFPQDHAFKQWQRDHSLPHALIAFHSTAIVTQTIYAAIVQLPLGFCETKYPGYFWNANERKLYSLKTGVLKEIKRRNIMPRTRPPFDGYQVSHLGKRRYFRHEDMLKIVPTRAVIPQEPIRKKLGSRW